MSCLPRLRMRGQRGLPGIASNIRLDPRDDDDDDDDDDDYYY